MTINLSTSRPISTAAIALLALAFGARTLPAREEPNRIEFKSDGVLQAEVLAETKDGATKFVVVETANGAVFKLEKSKLIRRISGTKKEGEQYQDLAGGLDGTPESHWRAYQWCRDKSRRGRFTAEALYHLRQIVKLDPSDNKAWQSFEAVDPANKYINVDGNWVPEQQHFLSMGYVKVGGEWVSSLQKDAQVAVAARERLENDRKGRLKKWQRYVLPKEDAGDVRAKLFDLMDPVSVKLLEDNYLKREKNPRIRALYLEAVGQVRTADAQRILVTYLMSDPVPEVREQAMTMLEQKGQYDPDATTALLSGFLRSKDNDLVNAAARRIGRFKRSSSIPGLVNALSTTHVVKTGNDPDRVATTFNSQGGTGMKMGGNPTRRVTRDNEDVLEALEGITGQSLGYDKEAWRSWYLKSHGRTSRNVRRHDE